MILPLLLAGTFASLSAQGATAVFCAGEGGAQKRPVVTVKAGGGNTLFLCAVKSKKAKGRTEVSGLKVFSLTKAGKKRAKPVFAEDLDTKVFSAEAKGEELVMNELVSTGQEKVPGYEVVMSCDSAGCKHSRASCVFKKPSSNDTKALEAIGEFMHGKKQGKVPDPKLINRLAALAFSGNEEALKAFKDRGGMGLDGAASDRYYEHQETIERLRKAGCF